MGKTPSEESLHCISSRQCDNYATLLKGVPMGKLGLRSVVTM